MRTTAANLWNRRRFMFQHRTTAERCQPRLQSCLHQTFLQILAPPSTTSITPTPTPTPVYPTNLRRITSSSKSLTTRRLAPCLWTVITTCCMIPPTQLTHNISSSSSVRSICNSMEMAICIHRCRSASRRCMAMRRTIPSSISSLSERCDHPGRSKEIRRPFWTISTSQSSAAMRRWCTRESAPTLRKSQSEVSREATTHSCTARRGWKSATSTIATGRIFVPTTGTGKSWASQPTTSSTGWIPKARRPANPCRIWTIVLGPSWMPTRSFTSPTRRRRKSTDWM
mmetsp:Transcript_20789/g.59293  ORF Transcript_20789/g.59293 Transcript_20789/m.59293 type:complete len:284 (+) Transcript_20789:1699-2550(+)